MRQRYRRTVTPSDHPSLGVSRTRNPQPQGNTALTPLGATSELQCIETRAGELPEPRTGPVHVSNPAPSDDIRTALGCGYPRRVITNVYVDGFNLYYGCLKGQPHKWLDLEAICARLLPKNEIKRIRYFTARVKEKPGDLQGPVRQQAYLRALYTLPKVEVHFGNFMVTETRMPLAQPPAVGAKTVKVIKTEEKGSDVNLATYLLVDAFRDDAEAFVVVSNDSDLTEPIRIVRHELGKVVGLLNPQPIPSRMLMRCNPNFIKQIRGGVLRASQFPPTLIDAVGATITKPADW
jgi:uncharacterized LabA/DUF88 family protein